MPGWPRFFSGIGTTSGRSTSSLRRPSSPGCWPIKGWSAASAILTRVMVSWAREILSGSCSQDTVASVVGWALWCVSGRDMGVDSSPEAAARKIVLSSSDGFSCAMRYFGFPVLGLVPRARAKCESTVQSSQPQAISANSSGTSPSRPDLP